MENGKIHYQRLFPWLHIFRALRIAADPRKLLLASVAYLLLLGGNHLINQLPFAPKVKAEQSNKKKADLLLRHHILANKSLIPRDAVQNLQLLNAILNNNKKQVQLIRKANRSYFAKCQLWVYTLYHSPQSPLRPLQTVVEPVSRLFQAKPTVSSVTFSVTQIFWALTIWAIFGGAICRMTALRFAQDTRISVKSALQFSGRRFLSSFSAPLLPVSGVVCMWLVLLIGGWIGNIPSVGGVVVGVCYGIALLVAFGMGLIMLGVACGWSLMQATISVEDSDAFDGFSRSFSYVFSKPWHFIWYAVVAMLFGVVSLQIVQFVMLEVSELAGWGLSTGMNEKAFAALLGNSPSLLSKDPTSWSPPADGLPLATWFAVAWHYLAGLFVFCFRDSYFWVASTIIYFLLRRAEDATDFNEIHIPEGEKTEDLLPLVGVAASEQPIIERPHEVVKEENADDKQTEE